MFKGFSPTSRQTKFRYTPRYYNQKNQNLLLKQIGNQKYASSFIQKKMKKETEQLELSRVDFSNFKVHERFSRKKLPGNVMMILIFVLILLVLSYILSSETLGFLYKK